MLLGIILIISAIGLYILAFFIISRCLCPNCKHLSFFNKRLESYGLLGCAHATIFKCKKCGTIWENISE